MKTFDYPVQKTWSVKIKSPSSIKEAHKNMTDAQETQVLNGPVP